MAVEELDSTNELTLMRVRSLKNEIMIAPGILMISMLFLNMELFFRK